MFCVQLVCSMHVVKCFNEVFSWADFLLPSLQAEV